MSSIHSINNTKKHIILDIDGALIDGYGFTVNTRPGLKSFFKFLFNHPLIESVSIWTSATKSWYRFVYDEVFRYIIPRNKDFYLVYTRNKCKSIYNRDTRTNYMTKPLYKIWRKYKDFDKDNTIIIDDTPETYYYNNKNAIPIKTYSVNRMNHHKDIELYKLQKYLDYLLSLESVREVDNHNWSRETQL